MIGQERTRQDMRGKIGQDKKRGGRTREGQDKTKIYDTVKEKRSRGRAVSDQTERS